jgi:hypothetical protein
MNREVHVRFCEGPGGQFPGATQQMKVFDHAVDFLAALARHVPKARQQTVTYAGCYANAQAVGVTAPDRQPFQ